MTPAGLLVSTIKTARPYTAAYVLVCHEEKYLFVRREKTGYMDGYYGLPSGKMEDNEGFMAAAIREAKEEVGIDIDPSDLTHAVTLWRQEGRSGMEWCDVAFYVDRWQGVPQNAEPQLHSCIAWLSPDQLPENVVPYHRMIVHCHRNAETYGEYHTDVAK